MHRTEDDEYCCSKVREHCDAVDIGFDINLDNGRGNTCASYPTNIPTNRVLDI